LPLNHLRVVGRVPISVRPLVSRLRDGLGHSQGHVHGHLARDAGPAPAKAHRALRPVERRPGGALCIY